MKAFNCELLTSILKGRSTTPDAVNVVHRKGEAHGVYSAIFQIPPDKTIENYNTIGVNIGVDIRV